MIKSMQELVQLAQQAKSRSILKLFENKDRAQGLSISAPSIYLDYSKQNISEQEMAALCLWAEQTALPEAIGKMFAGESINNTERRAVLHTVLRAPSKEKKAVLGEAANEVIVTEQKMAKLVDDVSNGKYKTITAKKFTDVLALGIGGSYYGVKVALSALKPYNQTGLNVHVLANVDGDAVTEKLEQLSPETTLVVVISKTFSTQETLLNAKAVKAWMLKSTTHAEIIKQHWLAVSTNIKAVTDFGIAESNILPMWDWVGGRFSLWSAVGLPLALAIGNDNFSELKQGAYLMDTHFKQSSFEQNMPVIMALLGIWNRNGLGYSSLAILPYSHPLRALPGYLQQTDMESNGKSVSIAGEKLPWLTAPVVFGQEGTNSQHAFLQLMHQSDDIIPTDFIVCGQNHHNYDEHHRVLVANCFAQSEALMRGKSFEQAKFELLEQGMAIIEAEELAKHKAMKGNTPSNTLMLDSLTPQSLGTLLALYEHKIFVQGILWQLNSFDQWGVELGKQLSGKILKAMAYKGDSKISCSTESLISRFNQLNS